MKKIKKVCLTTFGEWHFVSLYQLIQMVPILFMGLLIGPVLNTLPLSSSSITAYDIWRIVIPLVGFGIVLLLSQCARSATRAFISIPRCRQDVKTLLRSSLFRQIDAMPLGGQLLIIAMYLACMAVMMFELLFYQSTAIIIINTVTRTLAEIALFFYWFRGLWLCDGVRLF